MVEKISHCQKLEEALLKKIHKTEFKTFETTTTALSADLKKAQRTSDLDDSMEELPTQQEVSYLTSRDGAQFKVTQASK